MRKDSRYEKGKRSHSWLKVINYQYDNVLITGIRKGEFGVLLNFLDGKPAGLMEFMPPSERKKLDNWKKVNSEDNKSMLIKPVKFRIKFRNLTIAGFLRIPSIVQWN